MFAISYHVKQNQIITNSMFKTQVYDAQKPLQGQNKTKFFMCAYEIYTHKEFGLILSQ